jgi:hypothetical protein
LTYEKLAAEVLAEAGRIDAAEDEIYGEARGDELPEGLRTSGDRRQRLREAKQALEAKREAQAEPVPRDRAKRLSECKRRLEEEAKLERWLWKSTKRGAHAASQATAHGA